MAQFPHFKNKILIPSCVCETIHTKELAWCWAHVSQWVLASSRHFLDRKSSMARALPMMLRMCPLVIKIMLVMVMVLLMWLLSPLRHLYSKELSQLAYSCFLLCRLYKEQTQLLLDTNQKIHKASAPSYCNSPLLSQPSRHWPPAEDCILHQQVTNVIIASQPHLRFWRTYLDIPQMIARPYLIWDDPLFFYIHNAKHQGLREKGT